MNHSQFHNHQQHGAWLQKKARLFIKFTLINTFNRKIQNKSIELNNCATKVLNDENYADQSTLRDK